MAGQSCTYCTRDKTRMQSSSSSCVSAIKHLTQATRNVRHKQPSPCRSNKHLAHAAAKANSATGSTLARTTEVPQAVPDKSGKLSTAAELCNASVCVIRLCALHMIAVVYNGSVLKFDWSLKCCAASLLRLVRPDVTPDPPVAPAVMCPNSTEPPNPGLPADAPAPAAAAESALLPAPPADLRFAGICSVRRLKVRWRRWLMCCCSSGMDMPAN